MSRVFDLTGAELAPGTVLDTRETSEDPACFDADFAALDSETVKTVHPTHGVYVTVRGLAEIPFAVRRATASERSRGWLNVVVYRGARPDVRARVPSNDPETGVMFDCAEDLSDDEGNS